MKITKLFSRFWLLTPVFFAVSFILSLYQHNIGELSLFSLILPVLVSIPISLLVALLFRFIMKDKAKAALFSAIFMVLFFSYGEVVSIIQKIPFFATSIFIQRNLYFLLFWFFLFFFILAFLKWTKIDLLPFAKFIFIIATIVFALPLLQIGSYQIKRNWYLSIGFLHSLPKIETKDLPENLPDIYFILPDSYSAASALKKHFHYDNTPFIDYLTKKDFYVATESASNYPKTFLSLTSTLNMEYLDYLSVFKNSSDKTIVTPLIEENTVLRFLKSIGYRYYHLGSWWEMTHYNHLADENILLENKYQTELGGFNYLILDSTFLKPFITKVIKKIAVTQNEDDQRERILFQLEELSKIPKKPGPKFVFTHILAPHSPYMFGKNCEYTYTKKIQVKSDEENYTNEINCLNKKLEQTIDTIIANSVKPPVILLQSDEGAGFLNERIDDRWTKAGKKWWQKKFPILSAYYLPGVTKENLYPGITPVNSFRLILNLYFSTHLPLLPDKSYVFPDNDHYYNFQDITSEI